MKRSKPEEFQDKTHGSATVAMSVVPGTDSRNYIKFTIIGGKKRETVSAGRNRLPTLQELEQEYIRRILSHVDGNRTRAAAILGIDRVSLWRKIKRQATGTVAVRSED